MEILPVFPRNCFDEIFSWMFCTLPHEMSVRTQPAVQQNGDFLRQYKMEISCPPAPATTAPATTLRPQLHCVRNYSAPVTTASAPAPPFSKVKTTKQFKNLSSALILKCIMKHENKRCSSEQLQRVNWPNFRDSSMHYSTGKIIQWQFETSLIENF